MIADLRCELQRRQVCAIILGTIVQRASGHDQLLVGLEAIREAGPLEFAEEIIHARRAIDYRHVQRQEPGQLAVFAVLPVEADEATDLVLPSVGKVLRDGPTTVEGARIGQRRPPILVHRLHPEKRTLSL